MANIPRPPFGAPITSHVWMEWFRKIYDNVLNPSNVSWGAINFTGSDLNDIAIREHNVLQTIQGGAGGEYYHLKQQDYDNTVRQFLQVTKTTNSTAGIELYIWCDASSGSFILSLPDATLPNVIGRKYVIKKIDSSVNTITIDPFSTQTIDNAVTKVLGTQWEVITVVSNGSNWYVV